MLDLTTEDKTETLCALVRVLVENSLLPEDKSQEVLNLLLERENLASTGLGYGVALPHIKTNLVNRTCIVFGRSAKGVEFEALDGNPVNLLFLILSPERETEDYLKILSSLSGLMKDPDVRAGLMGAKTVDEVLKILNRPV